MKLRWMQKTPRNIEGETETKGGLPSFIKDVKER